MMKISVKLILLLFMLINSIELIAQRKEVDKFRVFELDSKPYARYWWFASVIQEEDVRYNLDWLKENGFGGVEVAWVYPHNRFDKNDLNYTPRQEWLSPEWVKIVDYTIRYADSIGLGCDLTFGTLWPFGDTAVTFQQATRRFGDDEWRQQIRQSWQHPKVGYVIDHLSQKNYQPYFNRLISIFPRPLISKPQAYFIDSWEVETKKLWCEGFEKDFLNSFGYDIVPFMDYIYNPAYNHQLYDYISMISTKVLNFYADYDSTLNTAGILSRGQVSGAPCDLISGYALLDIPEGESMLFEPEFCAIPASAALLTGKKYVSSETFTCLYGWPRDYIREEQTADLKLVADALFANGINHIVWHGMPHNPRNEDSVSFYATTHIGKNSAMAGQFLPFNQYLEKVSSYMSKGSIYSDIAVYLPTEDAWIGGVMPMEKQFKWAWGFYEMRYVKFPPALDGFNPTWINGDFLQKATLEKGTLIIGDARYRALYVDVEYLGYQSLKRMTELAAKGLQIFLKQEPTEPGTITHPDYKELLEKLKNHKNVSKDFPRLLTPFISGKFLPKHWIRKDGDSLYVFFPNPKADSIQFPLEYGQSLSSETRNMRISINYLGRQLKLDLSFKPYQSLLFKIVQDEIEEIDIEFLPETPVRKKRPEGYEAPWLVR